MNGKGSRPRNNFSDKYREGYDLIFRKKKIKPVVHIVSEMERYTLLGSDRVLIVHSKDKCKGSHCTIHNHSDHHMKDWPQNWREDRGIMERICPHGIGHPDPDDPTTDRIHGCDGCCIPPDENARRSHR
jgi:hypothetical protein